MRPDNTEVLQIFGLLPYFDSMAKRSKSHGFLNVGAVFFAAVIIAKQSLMKF